MSRTTSDWVALSRYQSNIRRHRRARSHVVDRILLALIRSSHGRDVANALEHTQRSSRMAHVLVLWRWIRWRCSSPARIRFVGVRSIVRSRGLHACTTVTRRASVEDDPPRSVEGDDLAADEAMSSIAWQMSQDGWSSLCMQAEQELWPPNHASAV